MTKSSFTNSLLDNKVEDNVRKAHRAGKKSIVINGRKFNIKKITKPVTFVVGGKETKRKEHWLTLTPADGRGTAMAQIELKPMGNLRSDVR